MPKATSHYVCQSCGSSHPKWSGKCDACGGWNTLVEEALDTTPIAKGALRHKSAGKGGLSFVGLQGQSAAPPRLVAGMSEFDRVCGGGLVPGSVLLVGGDPGIGKSTLLLQVLCKLAGKAKVAYISGEESIDQVRLRATRLGLMAAPVSLAAATALRDITAAMDGIDAPDVLVIDSIQTMHLDVLDSAPGTVAQVRACAQELIRIAKKRGICVIMVGHVTKEGTIAGPRVLEHMVDTVLYFEGERGHHFRILRAVKNRFGATDEIGVFDMGDAGLAEVPNPSALFLAERQGDISGSAVFAGMEGTRPVLVEIQALVSPSSLGTPRRAVIGWDSSRLAMVLAVLEARCGVTIGAADVYLNIAGGLRINEPAADLAVAGALLSAITGQPLPKEAVLFGEIGLGGEIRAINQTETRLKEAAKLGFSEAYLPKNKNDKSKNAQDIRRVGLGHLRELLPLFGNVGKRKVLAS